MYKLYEYRTKAKLTQEQVAQHLGTAQHHYSRYEREEIDIPAGRLLILCELYGCSADDLLGRTPGFPSDQT